MKEKIKKCVSIGCIAVPLVFFVTTEPTPKTKELCYNDHCFEIEVADSTYERSKGLMFRKNLDEDKGMLFVFPEYGDHSFWMKNTWIPLDIIWINKEKEVVYIHPNAKTCRQYSCPSIDSPERAKYVLELNGGIAEKINLTKRSKLEF